MSIEFLHEHDLAGWRALNGLERRDDGWGRPAGQGQLPLVFSVKATKPVR